MANRHTVEKQLKHIKFNLHAWGRGEAQELPNILLDDEKIFECVNGIYDGGFALLVATDIRVLLIDKKPLNYLTVEDLRFDMINEIDYSHRLLGAHITVTTGSKTLRFRSYNQQRLRKLINHVQHRMAEVKQEQAHHQEDQKEHLQQINQQLQSYLLSQYQQQLNFQEQLRVAREQGKTSVPEPEPIKPNPELSDFLFAQSLLKQYDKTGKAHDASDTTEALPAAEPVAAIPAHVTQETSEEPATTQAFSQAPRVEKTTVPPLMADLYAEGMHEIFGRDVDDPSHHTPQQPNAPASGAQPQSTASTTTAPQGLSPVLVVNPLRIAYSKLPMALRNRKFGRPSFHAHSQAHAAAATAAAAQQAQAAVQ